MAAPDIAGGRRWWLLPAGAIVLGLLLTVPFWQGDLDLRVAQAVQAWNDAQGGDQEDRWWWLVPYYLPMVLSLGFALAAVGAVVGGLLRPERGWLRPGIYLAVVMVVGIGAVTNLVLKDQWGRPRPRDTVHFGGSWDYLAPWQKGPAGRGKSFPCGHATVPALGFALWLLWRRRRPALARWTLGGAVVLTVWVAAARMLAQAHWLSDVLWAVVLMVTIPALLHRLLLATPAVERGPPQTRLRWPAILSPPQPRRGHAVVAAEGRGEGEGVVVADRRRDLDHRAAATAEDGSGAAHAQAREVLLRAGTEVAHAQPAQLLAAEAGAACEIAQRPRPAEVGVDLLPQPP